MSNMLPECRPFGCRSSSYDALKAALAAKSIVAVPTGDQPPAEILAVNVSVSMDKACGDKVCDSTESAANCPSDCNGPLCNNGKCEAGETSASCPWDCKSGASGPVCGDGKCDTGEATTCAKDCSTAVCGNGKCETGEVASCPKDCQSSTNNSCAGYCTKQAPGGCWCDDACAQNGDCCADKAAKCNAGCQGKCGGESFEATGTQCYCDSICAQNNDCCADKKTYCP